MDFFQKRLDFTCEIGLYLLEIWFHILSINLAMCGDMIIYTISLFIIKY